MNITEEMLSAFNAGWVEHVCDPLPPPASAGPCCTRSGLARVAPLIAAQALRSRDADVAEALRSARSTLTLSSQDWSVRHDLAWLYGILVGWDDDPDDPHPVDAMADVAARCGWNADSVARLRRLAAAVAGVAYGDTTT